VRAGAVGPERVVDDRRDRLAGLGKRLGVLVEDVDDSAVALDHVCEEDPVDRSPIRWLTARLGVEVRLVEDDRPVVDRFDRRLELPHLGFRRRA